MNWADLSTLLTLLTLITCCTVGFACMAGASEEFDWVHVPLGLLVLVYSCSAAVGNNWVAYRLLGTRSDYSDGEIAIRLLSYLLVPTLILVGAAAAVGCAMDLIVRTLS